MREVERENPSAQVTSKGGIEAMINGFEMSGAHARFTIADFPAYSGPTESHLYLFALGGWYLKFRLSHPAEIASEVSPREKAFIESFTWPIPEEHRR